MSQPRDGYTSPLSGRYASAEMQRIWSDQHKFATWRTLWLALARTQRTLGLDISEGQLQEMAENLDNIDFERAAEIEREIRHDVMAHVRAYGEAAPGAAGIIHLGATSCFITDNTELIQMKESLKLLCIKLARVVDRLGNFAEQYAELPTLGFTHFQPAQLTTVGKRACLWLQEYVSSLGAMSHLAQNVPFRGAKGTTGTQASYLKLFEGDHEKVKLLDSMLAEAFEFPDSVPVCGQSYTRRLDTEVVSVLGIFAASAAKCATDLRLLQSMKEIEEPFGKQQVGSSAMAYKRNPMRSERLCALARQLGSHVMSVWQTQATQWFERTLDDSAARRFDLAESFLLADAICQIAQNVFEGLVVYPKVIERHVAAELPFMATEDILMAMVQHGVSRQECHERIRDLAQQAGDRVKVDGADNTLLTDIAADDYFEPIHGELNVLLDPATFVGRAPEQTHEYVKLARAAIRGYQGQLAEKSELNV